MALSSSPSDVLPIQSVASTKAMTQDVASSTTLKENDGGGFYGRRIIRIITQKGFYSGFAVAAVLAMGVLYLVSNAESSLSSASAFQQQQQAGGGGYVSTGTISGAIFTGDPYRNYGGKRVFRKGWEKRVGKTSIDWDGIQSKLKYYKKKNNKNVHQPHLACRKWAVVTTIFAPSEALIDIANLQDWCMVVVGDTKTAKDWRSAEPKLKDNEFFLSIEEQDEWLKLPGEIGKFFQRIPYKHFARKNIGFLYAILRGADMVYDFDDDNYLNKDKATGQLLPLVPTSANNENEVPNVRFIDIKTKSFNHHPLMGATIDGSWARGFPMELIQDSATHGTVASSGNVLPMEKVGVIQYCADNNPDIDAIHRLTKPLPMNFAGEAESSSILVPANVYAPYNAQATLHTGPALFATLLPVSVPSRVTAFGVAFSQEKDLYYKSNKLVEYLSEGFRSDEPSLPARMEELWISLYERGYIEETDVELVQLW
eukprot:CAMPEP_0117041156 /NCGR_PEP_ID=MMETSP0472-20121206/28771_1 /TAXON_ID=693140 ORGANISM="Tiarina fusus, Strain LIS" /NCGR_SAMPLE_ID=MMETSP0472 /ASSEMBLY_ACC=CAM_ASM_000603 /LENGTH=482 /DNA_ID=CAMNT_0004752113 /DNA_START=66 /DNA_END=1512 /DNA_ORIENTATION=-